MTAVGDAWRAYYRPGMSSETAKAFKAGFASAVALADKAEAQDVNMFDTNEETDNA